MSMHSDEVVDTLRLSIVILMGDALGLELMVVVISDLISWFLSSQVLALNSIKHESEFMLMLNLGIDIKEHFPLKLFPTIE